MEYTDSSREERQKTNATKIQSIARGYNTRKLTNAIKNNSRLFLQRPSKKETYNKKTMILKRMFDKTNQAAHGTTYNAREEVQSIMGTLKRIEQEDIKKVDNAYQIGYELTIINLVQKIKNKLDGFNGTIEEARAKVYNDLEELRYLYFIPDYKYTGWHFQDQEYKAQPPGWWTNPEGKNLYDYYQRRRTAMREYIREQLPILFPNSEYFAPAPGYTHYMRRRGGRRKNRHTIKLCKKKMK